MQANTDLDELDRAIIQALQADPRTSNKEISGALGASEATIASRIRNLEEGRLLKVMLQRDFRSLGHELFVLVDIHVEGRSPEEVAAELAPIEEAISITLMMSDPELVVQLSARDHAHLLEIIETKVARVAGIRSFSMLAALEVVKLEAGYGTLDAHA